MRTKVYSEWDYKGMTVERVAQLATACLAQARNLNLKLKKKNIGGVCVGLLIDGERALFVKEYRNKYDFENTAQMFVDFHFILQSIHQSQNHVTGQLGKFDLKADLQWHYKVCGIPHQP